MNGWSVPVTLVMGDDGLRVETFSCSSVKAADLCPSLGTTRTGSAVLLVNGWSEIVGVAAAGDLQSNLANSGSGSLFYRPHSAGLTSISVVLSVR